MKTLEDLFKHQIKDLFSTETQILMALPEITDSINSLNLTKAFENHLEETKIQKSRLEIICRELNISPSGEKCLAIKEIIKEAKKFKKQAANNEVLDAGMIAKVQRIKHYEISGYSTAVKYAKELGHRAIAEKLQETLNEEYDANNTLDEIAENRINRRALESIHKFHFPQKSED